MRVIPNQNFEIVVHAALAKADAEKIRSQIAGIGDTLNKTTSGGINGIKQMGTAFNTFSAIVNNVSYQLQKLTKPIFELNKAQIELAKVTDLSGESMKKYTAEAAKVGEKVARSASQVLDAVGEFAKSGYSEADSLKLSEVALLYTNIADNEISAADSASVIISQMKAFNLTAEDSIHIIDAINATSNKFAVSSTDISQALSKTSAAMATLGNSYEQSIGLITAGWFHSLYRLN